MEYCAGGSIRTIIETCNSPLNKEQIAYVAQNTLKGLFYLHSKEIIHRDVKAANILITEDAIVKLADFGVSQQVGKAQEIIGSPLWMAPEVILNREYDKRCDIWSLGITVIEIADGLPPHSDMNYMRAMKMVPNRPPPTLNDPTKWPTELNNFLAKCLQKDPSKRPYSDQLFTDPFILSAKGSEVLIQKIKQYLTILSDQKDFSDSEEGQESNKSTKKQEKENDENEEEQDGMGSMVIGEDQHAEAFMKDIKLEDDSNPGKSPIGEKKKWKIKNRKSQHSKTRSLMKIKAV